MRREQETMNAGYVSDNMNFPSIFPTLAGVWYRTRFSWAHQARTPSKGLTTTCLQQLLGQMSALGTQATIIAQDGASGHVKP
jgi:hypothetical protein